MVTSTVEQEKIVFKMDIEASVQGNTRQGGRKRHLVQFKDEHDESRMLLSPCPRIPLRLLVYRRSL